jgi:hypothetical protein
MLQNIKERDRKNIECNLELKDLNECIKNNKINTLNKFKKIKCDKLFYDYLKCNDSIQIERTVQYSTK